MGPVVVLRQTDPWNDCHVPKCSKAFYLDQATARVALAAIQEKARTKGRAGKVPVRVYPCDVCDGWHLTAKPATGKKPPWDHNPTWVRPGPTDHLEPRSVDASAPVAKARRVGRPFKSG